MNRTGKEGQNATADPDPLGDELDAAGSFLSAHWSAGE
jgi:hypothetical protein